VITESYGGAEPKVPGGRTAPQPYYPTTSRAHRTALAEARGSAHQEVARHTPMMTNEVGRLLTAAEVAEMLHLHVNTVKRLGDRGELPFFRVCKRGDRRFRYDDVLEFLRRAK
jgi:excisionase family DNA binding protein